MNWKIIFQISTSGLIIALVSISPLTEKFLFVFTLIIFAFCAWIIAQVCTGKYFFHGFLVSVINSIWITLVHIVFWRTYVDHHPEVYTFIPDAFITHQRLISVISTPFFGALSGLYLGLFAIIASKIKPLKRDAKRLILILSFILFMLFGLGTLLPLLGTTSEQIAFVNKAKIRMGECRALGDQQISRYNKVLIWNIQNDFSAQDYVDASLRYTTGDGPVTVFLIGVMHSEQVGTYSVSGEPAYRDYVDIFVVQFKDKKDKGTAIGAHRVISSSPRQSREVQNLPEHGDKTQPIADWISSLSMDISNTTRKTSVSPLSDTLPAKGP